MRQVADADDRTEELMTETALSAAHNFERFVMQAVAVAEANAGAVAMALDAGTWSREANMRTLQGQLAASPNVIGFYIGMEPDVDGQDARHGADGLGTPGEGRYMMYAVRDANGAIVVEPAPLTGDAAEANWYHKPMQERRTVITPPYMYNAAGRDVMMTTISAPILRKDGTVAGIVTSDIALATIADELGALHPFGAGYVSLLSHDGQWVAHPNAKQIAQQANAEVRDIRASVEDGGRWVGTLSDESGTPMYAAAATADLGQIDEKWILIAEAPETVVFAAARNTAIMMIVVGLVVMGVLVFVGLWIGRRISVPARALVADVQRLSTGDYSTAVAANAKIEELDAVAVAMEDFREKLKVAEEHRLEREERQKKDLERAKELRALTETFDREVGEMVTGLASVATELEATAQSMSSISDQTSAQAAAVSSASSNVEQSAETMASASEELSASIAEIARHVETSNSVAGEAKARAESTREMVGGLSSAAGRIGEVVSLITDIASQTNLLALNATIEAARAGDAGKGFAVVANEVKNLASQTARATDEISGQIRGVQDAVEQTVAAMDSIASIIDEMNTLTTTISAAVEEQSAATHEIARNAQSVADDTGEVVSHIGGVSSGAAETQNAAKAVLNEAESMASRSDGLRRKVDDFLAAVTT